VGRMSLGLVAAMGLLLTAMPSGAAPAAGPSSQAAGELVAAMKSKNLDAIAIEHPEQPDRFVAAMLIPGVQLLVVSAKSTAPEYLRGQLAQQLYRDVYSTLQAAAVLDTKLFFQDMGSDGLSGESSVDIMYEHGTKQTIFDGDWKKQKISKSEYEERLRKADAEYSKMLSVLAARLRAGTPGN
jgi:hypothetical protein